MSNRVLLVSPPFYKPYSTSDSNQVQADSVPLGLGYIASYILKESPETEVRVIDFGVEDFSPERWRQELESFEPQVVGLSVLTLGYARSMVLARLAKEFDNDILTVAGGPHATVRTEECLNSCDIAVRGEGEKTFYEILRGQELDTIRGISYRKNGEIVHNEKRERWQDLDSLPFPAYQLFQMEKYKQFPGWGIIGSRGCPYNCIFCASPRLWGHVTRFRSPGNLVDEIEYLHGKAGIQHIVFQDDAMNMSQERAFEICDEIIGRNLHKKVSFECQVRANRACVSLELFRRMGEASFVDLTFGVESGSDRVMESLRKSLTVQEAREAIRLARQAGIPTVTGFFMVGNWGESILDVLKTWYFVYSNKLDMKLTVCTPLPGTEFEWLLKEKDYITDEINWENVNWVTPLNRTDKMPRWCVSLLYYLTVLLVHLPTSLLRGRKAKAMGLIKNIRGFLWNRIRGFSLKRRCRLLLRGIFKKTLQVLYGKGLGQLALVRQVYRWLFLLLYPDGCIGVNGHRMYTAADWWTSAMLLGRYEMLEMELFRRLIKKGMTVVDVGANIGYYTLVAAGLVGESGKVYAIEPEPANYALLAKNVALNGYRNVTLIQKAVSDKVGVSKLMLDSTHTGMHKLVNSPEAGQGLAVDVTTLDELLGDETVDVIKMDIEGTEGRAIQGMSRVIKRNKNLEILTEFVPALLLESGSSPGEYLGRLKESGFKVYQIDEKERRLAAVNTTNDINNSNLLCVREEAGDNILKMVEGEVHG